MARRSTPERIDEARRAATRNRLIGYGVTERAKAGEDGPERGSAYSEADWVWIAAQRKARKLPELTGDR